ncbi:hypothetical protein P3X46_009054 [Hevea brasiliensis]|uniref:Cysteine-rich transmembrane domain-containing protein n=1 Tax=Hevea brasiliensis TaxID=3981 RepID=A0ABQ9MP42_HEVBR|nr:hypothetical protein P3X46_009054 [Hevea brasiliensis]
MSQNQATAYPPASSAADAYAAPPPASYPTKDGQTQTQSQKPAPLQTKSKGDGFWKGCCAALCCCCVLDACF